MTTQKKLPSSIFPDMPNGQPLVNSDGTLTDVWEQSLNDVYQGLQTNFSNEGILFPAMTQDQINQIQSIYTPLITHPLPQDIPDISGKTVFDSTNRVPKQFIITYDSSTPPNITSASWKTITLT